MSHFLELMEEATRRHPEAVALVSGSRRFSYSALEAATSEAGRMIASAAEPGEPIGLLMNSSIELVVGLIAILKAGSPYVPLDPEDPPQRLTALVDNASLRLVLSCDISAGILDALSAKIIDERQGIMMSKLSERPAIVATQGLCYILYTSGTTGTPKGVVMPRRALDPLINWQIKESAVTCGRSPTTLQFAPSGFDVSFQEIASTLGDGGRLVIVDNPTRFDSRALLGVMAEEGVARAFLPPIILDRFAEMSANISIPTLREINSAGEQLRITPALSAFMERHDKCRLINQYGPTETHVVTAHRLDGAVRDWPILPFIGRPLPWVDLRIVDESLGLVSEGQVGEILIGGSSLAAGYLGQAALTANRFLTGPDEQTRLYRTGDLGRMHADGSIEYLGRVDRQLKIRGVRVEPGQIEAITQEVDGIAACAVDAISDRNGGQKLVACIVPKIPDDGARVVDRTHLHLRAHLPRHMVPSHIIAVHSIPLLANGKADRLALAELVRRQADAQNIRHYRTPAEAAVARIWATVLEISHPDPETNFFDLGGNSLALARVQSALREGLSIELSMAELLGNPTIRNLARRVSEGDSPQLRATSSLGSKSDEAIAIIGMSCRFPGAADPEAFWANLATGVESLTRWISPDGSLRAEGRLDGVDLFDNLFFRIPPAEAELLDPQHRLFLECAWEALEDAGYDPDRSGDQVGVFAGCGLGTYLLNNTHPAIGHRNGRGFLESMNDLTLMVAGDKDYLPTRVAYRLGLTGPAINVQTACSTALVAVHMACRSLRDGECNMALAGAASILVPQGVGHAVEEGSVFSSTGKCRPFDKEANGAVFGSGVGVVLLKRLSEALADRDDIHAIIRGSAINNDGADKVGFIAPSVSGQADVVARALAAADVKAHDIDYIECHGTATALGDAVEIAALAKVRGAVSKDCLVGSVKSNVGHLGWAAGMAGLIKTILALKNEQIPPTLHSGNPHHELPLNKARLRIADRMQPWPRSSETRRAGVSAFGIGGTNAHIVLEEAPVVPSGFPAKVPAMIALSGNSADGVAALAKRYATWFEAHDVDPMDVAYTLNQGRRRMPWRLAAVGSGSREVASALREAAHTPHFPDSAGPSIGFIYSGHGCQAVAMGRHLFETSKVFRATLERCSITFREATGESLVDLLYGESTNAAKLTSMEIGQPALFSVQVSLTEHWRAVGVHPKFVIGHSLGEFAAACAAGVMTLEDGVYIVAERGRLIGSLAKYDGATLAVASSSATVEAITNEIGCDIEIACKNSPTSTTVSGKAKEIDLLREKLEKMGIRNRKLEIGVAAHSRAMEEIVPEFGTYLKSFRFSAPSIPLISNVTGLPAEDSIASPEYWTSQLRQVVRFQEGVETMASLGADTLVEIGPKATLLPLVDECLPQAICLASLRPDAEAEQLAETMAALHRAGSDLDWWCLDDAPKRRLHLPTYPFERSRHWIGDQGPVAENADPLGLFAHVSWESSPSREQSPRDASGRWILFTHSHDFSRVVQDALVDIGGTCIHISHADEDTARLIKEEGPYRGAIFEFSPGIERDRDGQSVVEEIYHACEELVYLAGALADTDTDIWVVSRGARHEAYSAPSAAALSGMSRVISIEHPDLRIHRVDFAQGAPASLADMLVDEMLSGTKESQIRIGNIREVARLVPISNLPKISVTLESRATHLVVGGLGGLGLLIARWAAEHGAMRIVLAGRSAPSESAIEIIRQLRGRGIDIIVQSVDITNSKAVRALIDLSDSPSAPLRSVFHSAGILADGPALAFNEGAKPVLSTKVGGAWNLHHATVQKDCDLERFVLFSSVVGTIGNPGQAVHAAANSALDAFAFHRRAMGLPAQAIAWGAWTEIGALSSMDRVATRLADLGFGFIRPEDGFEYLDALLALDHPAVVCAPMNWARFLERTRQRNDPFFEYSGVTTQPAQNRAAGSAKPKIPETQGDMARLLRQLFVRVLGVEEGDVLADRSFFDLGLDSLTAIEMRNAIQERIGHRLPPALLFNFPTVDELAGQLIELVATDPGKTTTPTQPEPVQKNLGGDRRKISAQQRRWLRLLRADYGRLLVPIVIEAVFDLAAFREALATLINRHEVLRWRYNHDEAVVLDAFDVLSDIDVSVEDLSGLGIERQKEILSDRSTECRSAMPDPNHGASWALRCLVLSPERFLVLLSVQHLEFDGVSISLFVDELRRLYGAMLEQESIELSEPVSYAEYVAWQKAYTEGAIKEDRAFFQGLYANVDGPVALPLHDGFGTTRSFISGRHTRSASSGMMKRLRACAARSKTTPFALMSAAYAQLIASITMLPEVVIGTIVSGRPEERFRTTLGPFVAPFPVPIKVAGKAPLSIARRWNELITLINARSTYPVADLTKHVRAFKGLPEETYFADAFVMFNNYQRESEELRPYAEVIECLAPIEDNLLSAVDHPHLPEIAGLFLIIDIWRGEPRFNFWHHLHRFPAELVDEWSSKYLTLLDVILSEETDRP